MFIIINAAGCCTFITLESLCLSPVSTPPNSFDLRLQCGPWEMQDRLSGRQANISLRAPHLVLKILKSSRRIFSTFLSWPQHWDWASAAHSFELTSSTYFDPAGGRSASCVNATADNFFRCLTTPSSQSLRYRSMNSLPGWNQIPSSPPVWKQPQRDR